MLKDPLGTLCAWPQVMARGQCWAEWPGRLLRALLAWGNVVLIPCSALALAFCLSTSTASLPGISCCDRQTRSARDELRGNIIWHATPSCLVPPMQLQRVPSQWLLTIHFNEIFSTMEPCASPEGKDLRGASAWDYQSMKKEYTFRMESSSTFVLL